MIETLLGSPGEANACVAPGANVNVLEPAMAAVPPVALTPRLAPPLAAGLAKNI